MGVFWIIVALVVCIGIFSIMAIIAKRSWYLRKEYWEDWEEGLLQRIENWENNDQIDAQIWHDVQAYNRALKREQASPRAYFIYNDPVLDFAPIKIRKSKTKKGE